jgi:hypothetical protein
VLEQLIDDLVDVDAFGVGARGDIVADQGIETDRQFQCGIFAKELAALVRLSAEDSSAKGTLRQLASNNTVVGAVAACRAGSCTGGSPVDAPFGRSIGVHPVEHLICAAATVLVQQSFVGRLRCGCPVLVVSEL